MRSIADCWLTEIRIYNRIIMTAGYSLCIIRAALFILMQTLKLGHFYGIMNPE